MAATTLAFEAELLALLGGPTNLAPNPSGEAAPTFSAFTASTGGQPAASAVDSTAWSRVGTHSTRYTVTKTDTTGVGCRTPVGAAGIPVTAGRWYAFRLTGRVVSVAGAPSVALIRPALNWYVAGGGNATPGSLNGPSTSSPIIGTGYDLTMIGQASPDAAFVAVSMNAVPSVADAGAGQPVTMIFEADALAIYDLGPIWTGPSGNQTNPVDVPPYIDGSMPGCGWSGTPNNSTSRVAVGYPNPGRGLMAGAAYKLRQAYLAGIADPQAHVLAKNHPKQLKALQDNAKLVSFDAITAP